MKENLKVEEKIDKVGNKESESSGLTSALKITTGHWFLFIKPSSGTLLSVRLGTWTKKQAY